MLTRVYLQRLFEGLEGLFEIFLLILNFGEGPIGIAEVVLCYGIVRRLLLHSSDLQGFLESLDGLEKVLFLLIPY